MEVVYSGSSVEIAMKRESGERHREEMLACMLEMEKRGPEEQQEEEKEEEEDVEEEEAKAAEDDKGCLSFREEEGERRVDDA